MDDDLRLRAFYELAAPHEDGTLRLWSHAESGASMDLAYYDCDLNNFLKIFDKSDSGDSRFTCQPATTRFIASYLKASNAKSLLDPLAGSLLLLPVAAMVEADTALGIVNSPERYNLAQELSGALPEPLKRSAGITWRHGRFSRTELDTDERFDAVIGVLPPFGPQHLNDSQGQTIVAGLPDNDPIVTMLQACSALTPTGAALFVASDRFFSNQVTQAINPFLLREGLWISAALEAPRDAYGSLLKVGAKLIVIQRGIDERMFVGQITGYRKFDDVLLANLRAKRRGQEPRLGEFALRSEYRGFEAVAANSYVRRLGQNTHIPPRKLGDIALEFHFTRAKSFPGFTEAPNAIYIPLRGDSPVITSLNNATLKTPSRYAQVVLNVAEVEPEYVKHYFNTQIGMAARRELQFGSPRVVIKDLLVYLPDHATQLSAIENVTKITDLTSALATLQERQWLSPLETKAVGRELEKINREDTFPGWLDSLPFPLASILWTYHTIPNDNQRRYERLLQFFEALAEFLTAILVPGFQQEPETYARKKAEWSALLTGGQVRAATFGVWVRIVENLAKEGRARLNGAQEAQQQCHNLFKTANRDTLSMLFSSDIVSTLQAANELRNSWSGHTGIVSVTEARVRHTRLESLLSTVRKTYGAHWRNYRLIEAGSSTYREGIYRYQTQQIMGSRTPFEPAEVETTEPMEAGCLHVIGNGELKPLKLMPFIRVMPSPKTEANACYFYSRVESGDKLRFVSYHFEQDAEIVESFPDTMAALQSLLE